MLGVVVLLIFALAWWWSRSDVPPPTTPHPRLNIVLITIDTLRADRVGRGLTPALDAVAARGKSFIAVRATVPLTLPSHVSLMTGTLPPVHGVRENGAVFDRKRPTVAKILRDTGYATGAFVGAFVLNRRMGLDEGFDVYDDEVRRDADVMERPEAERRGAQVVEAALKWLPSASMPFFLWIHLYDPHVPYEPPPEYLTKASGQAYDGEVAYADAQVARVIAALDARGLTSSTAIVITGDHGEGLGDHGEARHGMLVYDSTLRVPLIVAAPGFAATARVPCHQDIAPGVLQFAGLDDRIPGEMGQGYLMRRAGANGSAVPDCVPYSESVYPRRAGWHALTSTADSRWKLIASADQELYDLNSDPSELRNVAAEHPNIVHAMSAALSKIRPSSSASTTIAPEAAERLRALGYVSGSSPIQSDDPKAPNPGGMIQTWTRFEAALDALQSDPGKATSLLKPLAAAFPDAQVFQSTYAQALRRSGRPRAALAIYRTAVKRWPTDTNLFHDLSAAAREAGDPEEALRAERAAIALDATNPIALNGIGLLHTDRGAHREAADAFEKAARGDSANPSYWTNLGNARRRLNDPAGAETAYRKAIEADASFADALNGLGTLLVESGRPSDAVPLFERALQSDPELHEARLNLGIAYQQAGNLTKAAETYREAIQKTPPRFARERAAAAQLLKSLK